MSLVLVPVDKIPSRGPGSKYRVKFDQIPKGQAIKLSYKEGNSARAILAELHKKGLYPNLKAVQRQDNKGIFIYIFNSQE